jgi:hypothetical protein
VFKGVGDFTGNGTDDLLFEDANGNYATWLISDNQIVGGEVLGNPGSAYVFKGIGDFAGNGTDDILFQDTVTGSYATWDMPRRRWKPAAGISLSSIAASLTPMGWMC